MSANARARAHTHTHTYTQLDDGLPSSPAKFACRPHARDELPTRSLSHALRCVASAECVRVRQAVAQQPDFSLVKFIPTNEAARTTRLPAEFTRERVYERESLREREFTRERVYERESLREREFTRERVYEKERLPHYQQFSRTVPRLIWSGRRHGNLAHGADSASPAPQEIWGLRMPSPTPQLGGEGVVTMFVVVTFCRSVAKQRVHCLNVGANSGGHQCLCIYPACY